MTKLRLTTPQDEDNRYVLGYQDRQFVCYFLFVGWAEISIGLHADFASPNIEIHIPFGFIRIGWQGVSRYRPAMIFGKDRQR